MSPIEAVGIVTPDHRLRVETPVPADISPGEHRVSVMIDRGVPNAPSRQPLVLSAYPVGLASDAMTFRREDLF